MKNHISLTFFSVLTTLLLAACGQQVPTATTPKENTSSGIQVIAEGHIVPNKDLKLFFLATGRVADILVSEGQTVRSGDVLARLGDTEKAEASLAAANLELLQAQQAYDEFLRTVGLSSAQVWENYQKAQIERADAQLAWESIDPNKIKDDIDNAQTEVQDKKTLLDDAKETLDKYVDLKTDNPTRRKAEDDLRKAEAEYNSAVRKVEDLQRSIDDPRSKLDAALAAETEALRLFKNTTDQTPDPDKKAISEARLNSAKAQKTVAEATINNFVLLAPFDGLLTDVNVTRGEFMGGDKFAFQMADTQNWFVETSDLTELEVVDIALGQSVELAPDALPGLVLTGTVESISSSYKSQGGDILYTVKIKLIDTDPRLRWGMTVQASFLPEAAK